MTTTFEERIKEAVEQIAAEAVVSDLAFAEIERRIAHARPRPTRLMAMAAAAAVVVAVAAIAMVARGGRPDEGSVAAGFERLTFDFEGGIGDALEPVGWEVSGLDQGYQVRAVDDRAHGGRWSARVALVGRPVIDGAGALERCVPAGEAAGKQVRLSGHIATDGVTGGGATLSMRRLDEDGNRVASGDTRSQPIVGTNDFTPVETVLDVPDGTSRLCLLAMLDGGGVAWFDDLTLELTGLASGDQSSGKLVTTFANLGFEDGVRANGAPVAWEMSGWPAYRLETTSDDPYRGAVAGRLRSDQPGYDAAGYAALCTSDDRWVQPGRLSVSAWLRPAISDGVSYLNLRVYVPAEGRKPREARTPKGGIDGTGPWGRHEVSIDVPAGASLVCFDVILGGTGMVDIDEVKPSR